MLAMILTSPPHSLQILISILKTRINRLPIGQDVPVPRSTGMCESGQVIETLFSAGVWSVSPGDWVFLHLPRLVGVTSARYLLLGANTPWKRVRLTLGLGTRETSQKRKLRFS